MATNGPAGAGGAHEESTAVVTSWNIAFGARAEQAANLLLSDPNLRRSDVVLLQEMDQDGTALIAEALGFHWRYARASTHPKSGRDFGNAVLSAQPITAQRVVALPHQARVSGQPRLVLVARTRVGDSEISVGSVHTEIPILEPARRRDQFRAVAQAVTDEEGAVVVGGDFNTASTLGVRRLRAAMSSVGLSELSDGVGPTFERGRRKFYLDHLFGRHVRCVALGSVDGSAASDHNPIWIAASVSNPGGRA